MDIQPREIVDYWYSDEIRAGWFNSTPELDSEIREKFADVWNLARKGAFDHWRHTAEGCLALVIILDQFPLNMFRGQAQAFASEAMAVEICLYAIQRGFDKSIAKDKLAFLYMPLMHSENMQHQSLSVQLFEAADLQENLRFARHHQKIIEQFGRFPHRNEILGRTSTPGEISYLNSREAFKG